MFKHGTQVSSKRLDSRVVVQLPHVCVVEKQVTSCGALPHTKSYIYEITIYYAPLQP